MESARSCIGARPEPRDHVRADALQALGVVGALGTAVRQIVARPTPEVPRARWEVQLRGAATTRCAVPRDRALEPQPIAVGPRGRVTQAHGHGHFFATVQLVAQVNEWAARGEPDTVHDTRRAASPRPPDRSVRAGVGLREVSHREHQRLFHRAFPLPIPPAVPAREAAHDRPRIVPKSYPRVRRRHVHQHSANGREARARAQKLSRSGADTCRS